MPAIDPTLEKPKQIVEYMARGIVVVLGLPETQVTPAIAPSYDPVWHDFPQVQVCPGAESLSGAGEGGQAGGDLFRNLSVGVTVFYRSRLDRYSESRELLLEDVHGLADLTERIRNVFAMTQLGTAGTYDALLFEPMRFAGKGGIRWEDPDNGIVRQDLQFVCPFAIELPTATTLNLSDVV